MQQLGALATYGRGGRGHIWADVRVFGDDAPSAQPTCRWTAAAARAGRSAAPSARTLDAPVEGRRAPWRSAERGERRAARGEAWRATACVRGAASPRALHDNQFSLSRPSLRSCNETLAPVETAVGHGFQASRLPGVPADGRATQLPRARAGSASARHNTCDVTRARHGPTVTIAQCPGTAGAWPYSNTTYHPHSVPGCYRLGTAHCHPAQLGHSQQWSGSPAAVTAAPLRPRPLPPPSSARPSLRGTRCTSAAPRAR